MKDKKPEILVDAGSATPSNGERAEHWQERLRKRAEEERQREEERKKKEEAKKAQEIPIVMKTPEPIKEEIKFDAKDVVDIEVKNRINKFKLSYIEDYEEEEAKRLVEESLGFEPFYVPGWQLVVKVYERPEDFKEFIDNEGNKKALYLPDMVRGHDKFVNCVGLVIKMGPDCYKGPAFQGPLYTRIWRKFFGRFMKPNTYIPWCKIGDWVIFHRNAGPQIKYRGHPMTIIEDKHVLGTVPCPTYVERN